MTAASVLRALFGRASKIEFDDAGWRRVSTSMPLLDGLDTTERDRLRELAIAFLAGKSIEPARGLELPRELPYTLAAQACLPILNLGIDWYRDWHSVLVYPGDFVARQQYVDEDGVAHELERELSGEAWPDGPVVLSLDGIADGIDGDYADNLVIHEMAHKLDLSNGSANGMPALHLDMRRDDWTGALSTAFDDLRTRIAHGAALPFDQYAAEDPGEFFAVISEAFFVEPEVLREIYPRVYRQFTCFYRQDPACRLVGHGVGAA